MFCVGYEIYTRERSPQVYILNAKICILTYLAMPPADSCVDDKPVSHREKYILRTILFRTLLFLF